MALGDAISSACYIKSLAEEMLYGNMNSNKIKITCYTDNYSLFETAHATTAVTDRRLRIEIAAIREAIKEGEVVLKWVRSGEQLANCLTKKGSDSTKLLERINGISM